MVCSLASAFCLVSGLIDTYILKSGLPTQNTFNVTEPAFYKELDSLFQTAGLDDIKTYLHWHVVNSAAPYRNQE